MVPPLRLRRPERRRFLDGEPAAFPLAGRFAAGGGDGGRDSEGEREAGPELSEPGSDCASPAPSGANPCYTTLTRRQSAWSKRLTMWRARSSRPSRAVPTLSMPFTSNNVSSSPLGLRVPPGLTPLRTKASSSLTNWRCAAVNAATSGLSSFSSTPRRSAARTRELNQVLNSTRNGLHSLWSRAQREHNLMAVASHVGGPARSRTLEQRLQHARRSLTVGATRRARGVAYTLC
jgi:hypothetical protein